MGDWSGPYPSDDQLADEWARKWAQNVTARRHAVLPALDMGMIDPADARRLFGMDLLDHGDYRRAPGTITIADLRAAMDAIAAGDARAERPMIEVTVEEWDALRNVEPMDWPRVYGLPTDLGGVHIVLVDIDTVRRRQAEMDELLGD